MGETRPPSKQGEKIMPRNIYKEENETLRVEAIRLRRELDRLMEQVDIIRAILMPREKEDK